MNINQLFNIAVQSIINNKLRTSLTILGVVVGIFSIIVIMTIITMLQSSIENGLSMLSKNTFQIQKHEPMGGPGHNRSDRNKKDITIDEAYRLKELLTKANAILYVMMNKGSRKEIVDIAKHIRNKAIDESNKPIIPDIDLILINYGQINQIKEPIKPDDNQGVIDVTSEKV